MPSQKKIHVPLICYEGVADVGWMMSIMGLMSQQDKLGAALTFYPISGESLIPRGRNIAASAVVHDPEASHLLFIDSDVSFPPGLIKKLLDLDVDVATAAYPKKSVNRDKMMIVHSELSEWPSNYESVITDFATEVDTSTAPAKLIQTDYAATGMMLIKRRVLERMIEAHPEIRYINDVSGYDRFLNEARECWDFFYTGIDPATLKYESEDYGFCRRWRELGGKITVLTDVTLGHRGKRTFFGNVYEQQQLFHEARKRIESRSQTEDAPGPDPSEKA